MVVVSFGLGILLTNPSKLPGLRFPRQRFYICYLFGGLNRSQFATKKERANLGVRLAPIEN